MAREPLEAAAARFVEHLRRVALMATRTCDAYETELRQGLLLVGDTLDTAAVAAAVSRPLASGARPSAATMRHRLSAWRTFGKYLVSQEGWPENPALAVAWAKVRRPAERPVLDQRGLQRLIEAAAKRGGPFGARDAAIVALFAYTGLRLFELVGLDGGHVTRVGAADAALKGFVRKGGNISRDMPLNALAAQRMATWLSEREELLRAGKEGAAPLFLSRRRRRISRRAVQDLVVKAGKSAGLAMRVTPHLLRHTFCTSLLREGVPFPVVQRLMDHTQLATTARYAHPSKDEERRAVDGLTSPDGA